MAETWHTVDATGHVPGVEAELPPGRVLLDWQGNMIDHVWDGEEVVEESAAPVPPVPEQEPAQETQQ